MSNYTVFPSATDARNSPIRELAVHDESRAIESAILTAINQGLYQVTVSNGTPMTNSITSISARFTANLTTNTLVMANHGFNTGDAVTVSTTGTLPAPLVSSIYYYAIFVDDNNIRLAASLSDALLQRPVAIVLSNVGSGISTCNLYAASLDYYAAWQGTTLSNPQLLSPYNDQMNTVIAYFTNLGYTINRIINTSTNNTLSWSVQW